MLSERGVYLLSPCLLQQTARLNHRRVAPRTGTGKSSEMDKQRLTQYYLIQVGGLTTRSIVCSCVQIEISLPMSSNQLEQSYTRSTAPLLPKREAPQVDAPLLRPLQSLVVTTLPVLIHVAVGGRLHALVQLHQVRPGHIVGHGIFQTPRLLHREVGRYLLWRGAAVRPTPTHSTSALPNPPGPKRQSALWPYYARQIHLSEL